LVLKLFILEIAVAIQQDKAADEEIPAPNGISPPKTQSNP